MSSDEPFPALFLSFPGKFNCLSPARHCVGHIAGIRSPENLNHLRSSSPSAIHALDDLWRRLGCVITGLWIIAHECDHHALLPGQARAGVLLDIRLYAAVLILRFTTIHWLGGS